MKAIGFANKFYTLWEISTKTVTTQYDEYELTTCTYIKNISFDLNKVRETYPDLEILDYLKGHSISFEVYGSKKSINNDRFNFGKYENELISECNDSWYLTWFYDCCCDERKQNVKNRLIELGYHFSVHTTMYDGVEIQNEKMYSAEEWANLQEQLARNEEFINKVLAKEPIEILMERNLTVGEDMDENYFGIYNHEFGALHFNDITVNYYNGYEYGLPKQKGKGKRVKGKTIVITDYDYKITGDNYSPTVIFVKEFNICK